MLLKFNYQWGYENEWRMFQLLKTCNKIIPAEPYNIRLFQVPKDCIKNIILGCRIDDTYKQSIIDLITNTDEYSHVGIIQTHIDEKEYKLNFKKVI